MASKKDTATVLSLSDIIVNSDWNSRSGDFTLDDNDSEGEDNDFKGLVESIRAKGQDEAVTVRPKGKKFELIAGFRRFAAITLLAKEEKIAKPTIKANIRDMNDIDARSLNIRENTARDDLKGADLAFGLHDLFTLYRKTGGKPSSVSLAKEIGKSQGYTNTLMNIMSKGNPEVLKLWRESPVGLNYVDMKAVTSVPDNRQMEEYKKLAKGESEEPSGTSGSGRGPDGWVEGAIKAADKLGTLFGNLARKEKIDAEGLDFWEDLPMLGISLKKGKDPKKFKKFCDKISKAANDAYEKAINAKDESPAEDSE